MQTSPCLRLFLSQHDLYIQESHPQKQYHQVMKLEIGEFLQILVSKNIWNRYLQHRTWYLVTLAQDNDVYRKHISVKMKSRLKKSFSIKMIVGQHRDWKVPKVLIDFMACLLIPDFGNIFSVLIGIWRNHHPTSQYWHFFRPNILTEAGASTTPYFDILKMTGAHKIL